MGWELGTNQAYLRELIDYWRDEFDWRAAERRLNEFDQFTTNIDGLDIHFVHQRAADPDAFPLILTHGWPGSFAAFAKVIEPLTDPAAHGGDAADAFHVVVPSIPGYGFSDRPPRMGYGRDRTAAMFAELMARLGYERYGAQGGDLGAGISRSLALDDSEHVAGLHLNLCGGAPRPTPDDPDGPACRRRSSRCSATGRPSGPTRSAATATSRGRSRRPLGYGLKRLAGGSRGLDRREVPELVRLRRPSRDAVQQGRAADDDHESTG